MHPPHDSDPDRPAPDPSGSLRITARGPAALAAALPYLVDRPVAGSAVLAVLTSSGTLKLTAHRLLPAYPAGASPEVQAEWADDIGRLVAAGVEALDVRHDEGAAAVIFLPPAVGRPQPWFAPRVMARCATVQPVMFDILAVFGDRWRSLACTDQSCCPAAGWSIMDNSDAVEVAAELVGAGLSIASGPEPPVMPEPREVAVVLNAMGYPTTVSARRALLRQAWPHVADPPAELSAIQVATLVMAADRPGVRDALLTRMARREAGRPAWWLAQLALWGGAAGAAPEQWVPGPACMLSVSAWALGEQQRALDAADRALAADPEHRMAALLRRLVLRGVPATDWFGRLSDMDETDCLRFDRPARASRSASAGREPRAAG